MREHILIKWQSVIQSSLAAYTKAGYNYTTEMATQTVSDAVSNLNTNLSPSFEGIFTIPVCNVSWATSPTANLKNKDKLLQTFSHTNQLQFCGPVCDNDQGKTDSWIAAANMAGFKSPTTHC